MATINTTGIFPSTSFIATNGSGDLQEVVSSVATNGSVTHDGLTFTAVGAGELANVPTITIEESATATGVEFTASGSDITMSVQSTDSIPATFDELVSDGITYRAETAGDSGILVTINESQGADAMAFSAGVLTIDLDDVVGNKTQGDIADLYALADLSVKDSIELTITDHVTALTAALNAEPLISGTDEIPAVTIGSYTQGQVETAFAGAPSEVTAIASLSIADAGTNLQTVKAQTSFNGSDAVAGNLDADSDYILIKRTDLHDLESGEQNDGRKFMWGLIHKAESVFAALPDKPVNFTISKTNPVTADQGTSLSQAYSVKVKYGIQNLDLKVES